MCRHISDDGVLSDYLDNLQFIMSEALFIEYQNQLQTMDKHPAVNSELDGTTTQKRVFLGALAQSIRDLMPDARQCPQCHLGPVLIKGEKC